MTGEQTAIPVPPAPDQGSCAWCGTTTHLKLALRKARYTVAANGTRVVAKAAQEVWCCPAHLQSLERGGSE